jgi:ribonuclease R
VIHSRRRFTYGEVLAILQHKPSSDPIEQMLHQVNELTQRVRRLRFKAGSLDLDFPESKIRLDERGRILRIERTVNDVSHQLVEECMLLANEAVAARLMSLRQPAIYRVHEAPEPRRLQEYREEVLSQNVPCGNLTQPREVQKLLERLNGLPTGPALKIGLLKSLMRARYAAEPLGHYGLAKAKYTHFTSPIRRFADLVVHRALFEKTAAKPGALKETAEHISITERNSADAERDSKDVKLFAFLKAQLQSGHPEPYPACVTDVRNFGFFVDVPGLAMSGLVPLSTVEDDFFMFDLARNQLVGRRTRRIIRLGDNVTVQVAKVDPFKKQVDFRLALTGRVQTRSVPPYRQIQRPTGPHRAFAPRTSGKRQPQSRPTPPSRQAPRPSGQRHAPAQRPSQSRFTPPSRQTQRPTGQRPAQAPRPSGQAPSQSRFSPPSRQAPRPSGQQPASAPRPGGNRPSPSRFTPPRQVSRPAEPRPAFAPRPSGNRPPQGRPTPPTRQAPRPAGQRPESAPRPVGGNRPPQGRTNFRPERPRRFR